MKEPDPMLRTLIAFCLLTSTAFSQPSIVTSGGGRSIVTSGAVETVKPAIPKQTSEAELLKLEIASLKSSLAAATAQKPLPSTPIAVPVVPVAKKSGNYIVAFTASWCGPCQSWKSVELPRLKAAGVDVTIVDVDQQPQWGVRSLPTFWVVDRATRRALRKFTGSTTAKTLQANISTAESKPTIPTVRLLKRLPVVQTRWGKIDLETYHKNCNCEMCMGIRALQRQYRQQYNPTSLPSLPAEKDFADVGQNPTPDHLITQSIIKMSIRASDVLADLGCGDGRVLIAAVKQSGCRAIGIEIDPIKSEEARRRVADAGMSNRIEIITGDVLDFDPAAYSVTAIFVHLYDDLLEQLLPKFQSPGVRVVVAPYHQVPGLPMQQDGDVWVYKTTSLFGDIGTSHESRKTLVNHLLTDSVHRGRHSSGDLARMSDEQLDALHSQDHAVLN